MADKKISQLTALAAANLAPSTDVLAIVDTSATETKKIVAQDLINGVLNVASAVGIGTASPGRKLDVVAANNTAIRALSGASGSYVSYGVGRTAEEAYISVAATANNFITGSAAGDLTINNNAGNVLITAGGSATQLYLNTSGNLGLGVTPSAWRSSSKALQIGGAGVVRGESSVASLSCNNYINSSNQDIYINTGFATSYAQSAGQHLWFTAASGTAGGTISFTQAMTLDASGNLEIGGTFAQGRRLNVDSDNNGYTVSLLQTGAFNSGKLSGTVYAGYYDGSSITDMASIRGGKENTTSGNYAGMLAFYTRPNGGADTERARITSGGQFLVGTTSTDTGISVDFQNLSASSNNVLVRAKNTTNNEDAGFVIDGNASGTQREYKIGINTIVNSSDLTFSGPTGFQWHVGGTERARITSGGYFKASNSGTYNNSTGSFHELYQSSASEPAVVITTPNASYTANSVFIEVARNTTNNSFYALSYYNTGAAAFKFRVADSGDVTNTNGTYAAISDIKLKEDVVDAASQWDDIKNLRVRKYRLKSEPDRVQIGLVAQEAETVSPGLIDEHADRDAEGNDLGTTTKSVKYSILYMKAVKALQEAMARIESLEAKVAALEAK